MMSDELKVFWGRANEPLARKVCQFLDEDLNRGCLHRKTCVGRVIITDFPDGEVHCKIENNVRGRDVFIIQPTCPPVNQNLMELLIMIDSFRRASAGRITAVIPYFGYARQDRKDAGRVPITAKLVANLISQAGADRILTMDLHSPQIQGFFDIPVDHLYAAPVFHRYFQEMGLQASDIVVVSPDEGSIKRALMHATYLGAPLAVIDKRRHGDNVTQANLIGGPIAGKVALLFDDMISTAKSICGAAEVVHAAGAREIYLAATHGVLCKGAAERLRQSPARKVLITDTIPLTPDRQTPHMEVLSVARLLAEAIKRIHHNESVSHLFETSFA
ncbi:MAG: ribose-phosphate pyrophosphokinase [Thermoguttaceae bacterium]|nr:ribose-phosphate pyrophosphokinase [Thermoguttaceae bacterium]MDW8078855.1 ribose-phosphate pyrophosphokinase [Thermoguttaceae bacterium]